MSGNEQVIIYIVVLFVNNLLIKHEIIEIVIYSI